MIDVDKLIKAIERCVCVRKLWRCNAGWGMVFVLDEDLQPPPNLIESYVESKTTVFQYYDTITQAVVAEYIVWVLNGERPNRGQVKKLRTREKMIAFARKYRVLVAEGRHSPRQPGCIG